MGKLVCFMATICVYNVPSYAEQAEYIVATTNKNDGTIWFYGAYENVEDAFNAAEERGGFYFHNHNGELKNE